MHRATVVGRGARMSCCRGAIARDRRRPSDSIVPRGRGSRVVGRRRRASSTTATTRIRRAWRLRCVASPREPARRTVAILGEMRELGDGSVEYHRHLSSTAAGSIRSFAWGGHARAVGRVADVAADVSDRYAPHTLPVHDIVAALAPGDVVLVKGSNRVFWADKFVRRCEKRSPRHAAQPNGSPKAPSAPRRGRSSRASAPPQTV